MSEAVKAFERAKEAIKSAEEVIDISLPTSANRIYTAGENLAYAVLLSVQGSASRNHGKLWNGIQRLHEMGELKNDYRKTLETSYRLRIKGDYGRDIDGVIIINKQIIVEQIKTLKKFLNEVENVLKDK